MEKLLRKYARTLLTTCLKVEEKQPLFISANVERRDFVRIVADEAYDLGITDIYFDLVDPYIKHDALKKLEVEDLKKMSFWNKEIWNTYAEKNAAFLMLASENPGLMKDIDPNKSNELIMHSLKTRKIFDEKRDKKNLAWCIAAVPTSSWAAELFPNEKNPVDKLWNVIFELTHIADDEPEKIWDEKIKKLSERAKKLNEYKFEKLIYKNSKGTNFEVNLPKNHIWASGKEELINGKEILVNFPTEEVFTSPDYKSANGIVYSSKPLNYQDTLIDEFSITFENGKAISSTAKQGDKNLEKMINSCENSCYLGEVALVENDSPISNSNIVFKETLFDENASCHLALGASFPECLKDGEKMTKEELLSNNLNQCDNHVDFMIGTKDLTIEGVKSDGSIVTIFREGNFTEIFK